MGDAPVTRARLTARRLFGLDRSGPPPPATLRGQPLNPWTIPNAIGFLRALLIPVFLYLAFASDDGTSTAAALIFAVIAWGDYADGMAARITGQYSRLGTLMDPLVDRLLILSGVAVCWHYELLPRWGLIVLAIREVSMIVLVRYGLGRGWDLKINWFGRIGVWFVMSAPFWAMVGVRWLALVGLYVGLALALAASLSYIRDAVHEARGKTPDPRG